MSATVSGIPVGEKEPVTLTFDRGRITRVNAGGRDDVLLAPGLVDIHCHGGGGDEFGRGDAGDAAARHHRAGTTTVLASLVTASPDALAASVDVLAGLVENRTLGGIHLEGPFLSASQCGAHDPQLLLSPDPAVMVGILESAGGAVRMVTLAPELPGAADLIGALAAEGVTVALGHTNADAATMARALRIGRTAGRTPVATHLFNGMPPFHHREPGAAWAALVSASNNDAWVEVISDGAHLAPATVSGVFALCPDRVILISDATAATWLPDGSHRLGTLDTVVEDGVSRLAQGGSLAGSVTPLLSCVQQVIATGVEPSLAFMAATRHPADAVGLGDVGRIEVGCRADVLVLDPDHRLLEVWRDGDVVQP